MFVRVRSRAGAPTAATWRRRADAGPSRGLEPADTGVDPETKAGRLGMRSPRRRPSGRLCRRPDRHATRPTVEDAAQLDRCYAAARVDLRAHPLVGTAPAAGPSWEISAVWQHDPSLETEVEVRFIAEGKGGRRVEREHHHLDRYAARRDEMRGIFDSEGGWNGLLASFARAAAA